MIRFLAILLVIYLFYKLIKLLLFGFFRMNKSPQESPHKSRHQSSDRKIISDDEGEYVDFEEMGEE